MAMNIILGSEARRVVAAKEAQNLIGFADFGSTDPSVTRTCSYMTATSGSPESTTCGWSDLVISAFFFLFVNDDDVQ